MAISVIQAVGGVNEAGPYTIPVAISTPSAGNTLLLVLLSIEAPTSITDSASGTWSLIHENLDVGRVYSRNEGTTGGPTTVTVAGNAAIFETVGCFVLEIGAPGLAKDFTPDDFHFDTTTGVTTPDITTARNGSLGLVLIFFDATGSVLDFTGPGGSWVEVLTSPSPAFSALYYNTDLGAAGLKSFPGTTLSFAASWRAQQIAFNTLYPVRSFGLRA